VWCRLVGVIEGKQKERGKSERNDRLIGVAVESRRYGMIKDLDDLGPKQIEDIGHFFEGYNRVLGRTFRLIGTAGAKKAVRLARDGMTGRKKSKPSR
jgi:inorganic pyrophosphatase